MMDKLPKHKRRTKSQIESYERDKQLLPFMKPKYVMQDMFTNGRSNKVKYAQRSQSIQKYSQNARRNTYKTEIIQQSWQQQSKLGYKLKDFYRNLVSHKKKQQETHRQSNAEEQNNDGRNIRFSFIKRRGKKHFNGQSSNKQEVKSPLRQQSIYHQKILFAPVLLNRNFNHGEEGVVKYGKIRRQPTITPQPPKNQHKIKVINRNLQRIFRKIGNAILFIVYLRRYNKKYQTRRKRYLQKNSKTIHQTLIQLKLYFSHNCSSLYEALCLKYQSLYQISQKDSQQIKDNKLSTIKHLINILIQCISKGVDNLKTRANFIELIYSICKHGSFSSLMSFHTQQQLDISCISSEVGYISGDHYLQQSSIIGFVFIKMIIFNIFLKPELINFNLSPLFDKTKLYHNMKLLGNIFYEILIDLQDGYLQLANQEFKIGNWRNLTYKFNVKASQSMTVKKGFYQKNELISGLIGHSYIKQTYQIEEGMVNESKLMKEIVIRVQLLLKEYHVKVSENCM